MIHFHYGGKFEESDSKIYYISEIGCTSVECECDRLSLPELSAILKDDCGHKSNVIELWWNNSKRSGELRRIIGDKEVIDMVAKLGKSKSVHVYAIDEHVKSLTLPHVTHRFVDTSQVQNQKEKAQLSTINGGNGSMENAGKRLGKRLVKPRFLPPGSLCRGRVQSLKTSCRPISMEAQTQGEEAPIKETQVDQTPIEAGPHAEVATKKNLGGKDGKVPDIAEIFKATRKKKDGTLEKEDAIIYDNILGELEKNPSMSQFELVEKCFGRQDRDRVICFGLGMKPKDVRGPEPSKADLKTQLQKKNQHINDLENRLNNIEHLETDHQKKIDDMQAAHKKDIEELQGEIKALKEIVLQKISNILPPSSAH
ncbi:hypothetical protein Cgig2_028702 [Carnegiea gigantea]|uniref:PB1-like domain-containing protein n=1 Tax=Carnegiea gigantea TaxID=171969 RepID=A0A9Q1KCQ6_9CARY|nr:hypothetical protein Cgig2_013625 [Carnegiea gigantea]KAJ8440573.1 hypothetical protein Cgig2_028702 [Carnegiea gigantea]